MTRQEAIENFNNMIEEDGDLYCLEPYLRLDRNMGDCVILDGMYNTAQLKAIVFLLEERETKDES